jgi:hypothetical protein
MFNILILGSTWLKTPIIFYFSLPLITIYTLETVKVAQFPPAIKKVAKNNFFLKRAIDL